MSAGNEQPTLDRVRDFVESSFGGEYEIYDVTLKHANGRLVLEVFIDREEGIKVEDCEIVSRELSKFLDEEDLIHRHYTLEVSSPGAERELKRPVDFRRQVGRLVRWALHPEGDQPREVFKARLQEFLEDRVVVQTEGGLREFPTTRIEQARAVLEFPAALKPGRHGR